MGVAFVVTLAAVVWALWPASGVFSRAAQASRTIVLVFAVTQLLLVLLYAPAFAATAFTAEKERNSYDLLFTTQLRPRQIVQGKLGAAVWGLVVLVVLSFPLFAACFFLGAVSPWEMAGIYLVSISSAVLVGLLGLCVSAAMQRSNSALLVTYLLVLALAALPWVPGLLFPNWRAGATAFYVARACSPVTAVAALIVPGLNVPARGAAAGLPAAWAIYLAFAVVAAMVLDSVLLVSVRRCRQPRPGDTRAAIGDPRELRQRRLRFPFYLIDPLRRRAHIPRWINPVFAKELRGKAYGGGVWVLRAAYLCFAVSLLLMWLVAGRLGQQSPDAVRTVAVVFQLGLVALVVPALTAGAVTQERERSNLDLLRLTRVGAARFLAGKLMVAAVFLVFLAAGFAPLWYVFHFLRANTPREILLCWAILGAAMWFALMTGLAASAVARRTAVATAVAYGVEALVVVATLFPVVAPGRLALPTAEAILAWNPVATALQVATAGQFQSWGELWRAHLGAMLGGGAVLGLVAYLRVRRLLGAER